MKKLLILSLFILTILIGCSNDDAYNNAIQKGLDYIASEEYGKAESAFELALDENKNDDKATALLEQTLNYQELLNAIEDNEWDVVNKKANNIIDIENGSSTLVTKAKNAIDSKKGTQVNNKLAMNEVEKAKEKEREPTEGSEKESNTNYEVYEDGPFGFSINYPTSFYPGPMQGNNDGIRFRDEEAEIYVSGSHHESLDNDIVYPGDSDSIKKLFNHKISELKANNHPINYQRLDEENNWFVISFTVEDAIIYQKNLAADYSFAELLIVYPQDSQDKYKSIVEKVAGSFTISDKK